MLFKRKQNLLALAVLSSLAMVGAAHATNGYAPHGIGTKSKGLAGSGSALPQDSMVMAMNPAGIVFVGNRIDAGAAIFSPQREYTVSGVPTAADPNFQPDPVPANNPFGLSIGTVESDSDYFLVPHFGIVRPINSNASWGVAVYGNGGMNTDYPDFTNAFCDFNRDGTPDGSGSFCGGNAGINLEQLFITPTYAQKFAGGKAAVGASLIIGYQRFEAEGLGVFGQFGFSSDAANLSENGADTSTGIGVRLAVMGEVAPGVTMAASYQPKMDMSEFDDYAGLFAEKGDFDIPSNWNLGLAWNTSPSSTLTFDIQGINFTDVASVSNSIANLPSPLNPTGSLFGQAGGPGFGWEDMTIFKLGYQWATANDWIWRVGVSTADQPIPSTQVTLNTLAPAVMEQHYTFGFTKAMGSSNELSFAAMYAPAVSVKGGNSFDPAQTVEIEMSQFDLELSYAWKF